MPPHEHVVIAALAGTEHMFRLRQRAVLNVEFGNELTLTIAPEGRTPTAGERRELDTILSALAAFLRGEEPTRGRPALQLRPSGRLKFDWRGR